MARKSQPPKKELYRLKKYGTYKTYTNLHSAKTNMRNDDDEIFIYELKGSHTKKSLDRERSLSGIIEGFPNKYQVKALELIGKINPRYANLVTKIKTSEELKKSILANKNNILRDHCESVEDYEAMLFSHNFRNIPKKNKCEYTLPDGTITTRWSRNSTQKFTEIRVDESKYENFKEAKKNIKKYKETSK